MKVISLKSNPNTYSCNVYLILGNWNKIENINALIDVGTDNFIINELETINSGLGKKKIDRVMLTHTHFDHIGGINDIKELYNPEIYSFSPNKYSDYLLTDGQYIMLGDTTFRVIHSPGHSSDSVCFYSEEDQVLFAGDTPVHIRTGGGSYTEDFLRSLERLSELKIKTIYHGHDLTIWENGQKVIQNTLKIVNKSKILFNDK